MNQYLTNKKYKYLKHNTRKKQFCSINKKKKTTEYLKIKITLKLKQLISQ